MWRRVGLTESAAIEAIINDGVTQLSEEDQLARTFRDTWGLSEAAAEVAARGRHGGSSRRPVSESQPARQAGEREQLITLIESWTEDLRAGRGGGLCIERGETVSWRRCGPRTAKRFLRHGIMPRLDGSSAWSSRGGRSFWTVRAVRAARVRVRRVRAK
jgi:hypothetical protein